MVAIGEYKQYPVQSRMLLRGRDKAKGAVKVLLVVSLSQP